MRVRLAALAVEHPRYGHLMLHAMLKMEGLVMNCKRTYRLYRDMGLQVRAGRAGSCGAAGATCLRCKGSTSADPWTLYRASYPVVAGLGFSM